ncbi:recombinase family protein [Candidatus Obscuribacterales bacterium]|nr:recombinase family protein [Cyclobacteriaceae bacterium]MBX3138435.1 recombinase family protein [Candidatus Obscuribacterales bacterium]
MQSTTKRRRVAIYARVSTPSQTVENQLIELRAVAQRSGWQIVVELTDNGISGAKGRDQRPAFDELLKRSTRREFDVVMVWAIDRIGRSIQHLVTFMNDMQSVGIDLYIHQQSIDTTTAAGRMIFGVFSALGQYERELIRERIMAGQQRARAQGIKIGRPSKMNDAVKTSVKLLKGKGVGIREIASKLEIGIGTVYSVLKAA